MASWRFFFRFRCTLAALLVVALGAGGCRADLREQRIARNEVALNAGGNPDTLDPHQATDTVSSRCILPFIRGLTVLDAEGRPQPEMAERWEVSEDGRTYDFYLREARWTNGEPVEAEDFAYAWLDRVLNPEFGSQYIDIMFFVEGAQAYYEGALTREEVGVEVVSPRHLRVRLSAPLPKFPQLVAHQTYAPVCRSADRENPDWSLRPETYVSNGPFRMTHFSSGDRLIGEKNPDYWNAHAVATERLIFRFIEEESTIRIAFENHEIDATFSAPRHDLKSLEQTGTLRIGDQLATYYLNFNMKREIFGDARVRRALALAIDRRAIVDHVTRARERPALGLVPPELYEPLEPKTYLQDADFDRARSLLAEAGYPDGEGFPQLHYLYNTSDNHRNIAQVIQEAWRRELGIDLRLENQEFRVVIENRRQGAFDVARNGWVADFASPASYLSLFTSYSGNNDSHWRDPEYDALFRKAWEEPDPEERLRLMRRAEDYLMQILPIVPVYFYSQPYLVAPGLEGFDPNPFMTIDAAKLRWSATGAQ